MAVDTDGDGVADEIGHLDAQGNLTQVDYVEGGRLAYSEFDTDGDGAPDTVAADADGDGQYDVVASDTDGDGKPDAFAVDTDGDGTPDYSYGEPNESPAYGSDGSNESSEDYGTGEDYSTDNADAHSGTGTDTSSDSIA